MWGEHSHISVVEYWRWWVVHLWLEGFFEVFAVAVISFLFLKLGLVRGKVATEAVLFATIVQLTGGVLGMFHHLYFAGTTTAAVAFGASFSALEVVPLAIIGLEAYETWSHANATPWMARYRWPIMFFLAVSFWNLAGAGLFGFLINTPLALYYMQGLDLTPLHGHTALFGVYGMLGIGLMLFCLRGLKPTALWHPGLLKGSFRGAEHRPDDDGAADPAADGRAAAQRRTGARLCLCAFGRVHGQADLRRAGVDAHARRPAVRHRCRAADLVRDPALADARGRPSPGPDHAHRRGRSGPAGSRVIHPATGRPRCRSPSCGVQGQG